MWHSHSQAFIVTGLILIVSFFHADSSEDHVRQIRKHPDEGPTSLLIVPSGGNEVVEEFIAATLPARQAVAIGFVPKASKRHKLLEELAQGSMEVLELLLLAVKFQKGKDALVIHRDNDESLTYNGKWTHSALRSWLEENAFPSIARFSLEFRQNKYWMFNPFGVVLISQPLGELSSSLLNVLKPLADEFKSRLKFTMFARVNRTEEMCNAFGVWGDNEILIADKPSEIRIRNHSNMPLQPKYRLSGVSPDSIKRFFNGYRDGTLRRHYKASTEFAPVRPALEKGLRILTSWDFEETIGDSWKSVFVGFISQSCLSCLDFKNAFEELAKIAISIRDHDTSAVGMYRNLTLALIDQTANEHSQEVMITPMMKYWPRLRPKAKRSTKRRPTDLTFDNIIDLEAMLNFLQDRLYEEKIAFLEDMRVNDDSQDVKAKRIAQKLYEEHKNRMAVMKPKKSTKRNGHIVDSRGEIGCIGGDCCPEGDPNCQSSIEHGDSLPKVESFVRNFERGHMRVNSTKVLEFVGGSLEASGARIRMSSRQKPSFKEEEEEL